MTVFSRGAERPPIAGNEEAIQAVARQAGDGAFHLNSARFAGLRSAFACALHMHQPTIPAGADGELISHLRYMFEHRDEGDNHNAEAFASCYKRLGDLIPQLLDQGCEPRIMLDYSGTLLWGFQQMNRQDILESLRRLTCDPVLVPRVEWLGTLWSHAVVPSTPLLDLKPQMLAWQQHFASLFGLAALRRVKGFSLPEMHLPNHPDTLHATVKALKECGYQWLLVQEHSVETLAGLSLSPEQRWIPNRLVARNSRGESETILALIKTQGSDTKLVGQMQPYAEARGLGRQSVSGRSLPALVSQIADGENGGVMMNEFPSAFCQAHQRVAAACDGEATIAMNGSEYLQGLAAAGFNDQDWPRIQAVHQHKLWQAVGDEVSPERVQEAITALRSADPPIVLEGASWTNHISWEEGYGEVLDPMRQLSARFHRIFDPVVARRPAVRRTPAYQDALLHVLLLETSCFRYWGQGRWTDYARELHRRGEALLDAVDTVL
ncbi:MAG: glycosyl hydrolase family 57 [Cyanobacteriota bacterium]